MITKILSSIASIFIPKAVESVIDTVWDNNPKSKRKYDTYKFTASQIKTIKSLHTTWLETRKVKGKEAKTFNEFVDIINNIYNTTKVPASIRRLLKTND